MNSEGQKMSWFSSKRRTPEPASELPEPTSEDTPPDGAQDGDRPAQVSVTSLGYGYPATYPQTPALHTERLAWRFQPHTRPAEQTDERPHMGADEHPPMISGKAMSSVRRSFALTLVAYGFFGVGIAINIWNARTSGGDWLDMGIPVALGVLAEAVLFFLPARILALPSPRRALAVALYAFVMTFAVVNSLRMASLIAADQVAARADRQTAGVQAAARGLSDARSERDKTCRAGQGKSAACRAAQEDVAKLERAQAAASVKVSAAAKPENTDFSDLTTWVTRGVIQPGARDFDMIWLLFRTFLPQIGGIVLMVAKRG
jgi:hypothetical protein